MRHDWREVPGSFSTRDRVADFRCARCAAWIVNNSPQDLPEGSDCPFPGNAVYAPIEEIPAPVSGQLPLLH